MAAYRYAAVLIGAGLAGLGGAFLTRGHSNQFVEGIASGRGCIAPGAALHRRIEEASDRYGLGVRPGAATETLRVGEQQRVEILKVLFQGIDLPILGVMMGGKRLAQAV